MLCLLYDERDIERHISPGDTKRVSLVDVFRPMFYSLEVRILAEGIVGQKLRIQPSRPLSTRVHLKTQT